MRVWNRRPTNEAPVQRAVKLEEPIIDLRHGEARYYPTRVHQFENGSRRRERPPRDEVSLPQRFRLGRRFPPLQRVVHYGPIDGESAEIRLTMRRTMLLHSTGVEHSLRQLEGRVRELDHLLLLVDSFGLDRRSLGAHVSARPNTLHGAKREWHKEIMAGRRHGFAMNGEYLVLLEYRAPERDLRRRHFGIAYKRIIMAYEVLLDDLDRHPRQHDHVGAW